MFFHVHVKLQEQTGTTGMLLPQVKHFSALRRHSKGSGNNPVEIGVEILYICGFIPRDLMAAAEIHYF